MCSVKNATPEIASSIVEQTFLSKDFKSLKPVAHGFIPNNAHYFQAVWD